MAIISIIVPVYNVEQYLDRCINSILSQSFQDFELILIDDGSTDSSGAICDSYLQEDNRVKVIHQNNLGVSAARNRGIDLALSNENIEWISFVDSDDWLHPSMIQALLDAIHSKGCKISICSYFESNTNEVEYVNDSLGMAQLWRTEDYYIQHNVNAVVPWGKLYHKECFSEIRFPIGKRYEDEFTTYKVLFRESNIAFVNKPLYFYFQHENSFVHSEKIHKRLVVLDALIEQIDYFKENNFLNAKEHSVNSYIHNAYKYLSKICKYNDESLEITHKDIKVYLRNYRAMLISNARLFPFKTYHWLYELAFPKMIKLYWMLKSKIRRI